MTKLDTFIEARNQIKQALQAVKVAGMTSDDLRPHFDQAVRDSALVITANEKEQLFETLVGEVLSLTDTIFGPLDAILQDGAVTEILINSAKEVFVERDGRLEQSEHVFDNNDHLLAVINRIIEPMGRVLDESHPIVDVRFPDGSLMHVVIPPIAVTGPSVTIRKARQQDLDLAMMVANGSVTQECADYLADAVGNMKNILITGLALSGKTTLLGALGRVIHDEERCLVIQHAEVPLKKPHLVALETRPANFEGRGAITMAQLMDSAVRMRPERLLVDEVENGETLVRVLEATRRGHNGTIFTMQSSSPRHLLAGMEIFLGEANPSMPVLHFRELINATVDLIITMERTPDGARRISQVSEITGIESNFIVTRDVFVRVDGELKYQG